MPKKLNFVYFGSSFFSREILLRLIEKGFLPTCVVSKPDMPAGRGLKLIPTQVSSLAREKNIPLLKPKLLNVLPLEEELASQKPDFFIIADYGKIIPNRLLKVPKLFPVCVHPSLLPLYRGATPIETFLADGGVETGVTIFAVNERVDAGDIFRQNKISVEARDNFFNLRDKLIKIGAELLIEVLKSIQVKKYSLTVQDESQATVTVKLVKEMGRINWQNDASRILNKIRAFIEWPGSFTYFGKIRINIILAQVVRGTGAPGEIISLDKKGIIVSAGKDALLIERIKPEGKNNMDAWAFVCGHKIVPGKKFT
ncbi:MAG: methionyl-tRNA formyltransferase [Candidatus Omnitrophica bacterium]|nr:methionyl-tRNA formyltransferase [Candidatus Omnitrophota bacterium]MDD5430314.1 methionyl-tRNA formyltransferase [Candidatus Omnitrophota bacterium]